VVIHLETCILYFSTIIELLKVSQMYYVEMLKDLYKKHSTFSFY
jgi:hypothetical protein